jgi:endonuclease III
LKVRVEVEEPFSLDLTLSPSFTSSMYVKLGGGRWVKVAGRLAGLKLRQVGRGAVEASWSGEAARGLLEEAVTHEVGGWHGPFEDEIHELPSEARMSVEALASAYAGVRLPLAPWDLPYVFIAIVLSRRAGYESSVLKWCRRLWGLFNGRLEELAEAPPALLRANVGSSYQVAQLQEAVRDLLSMPSRAAELTRGLPSVELKSPASLLSLSPPLARILLLRGCRFLGPKTVDSLVLTCFKSPETAPCDVHFKTVSSRLSLLKPSLAYPSKRLCASRSCRAQPLPWLPRCSLEPRCLRAEAAKLSGLAGWVQTLCYLHGSSTCRSRHPRCEACPLKGACGGAQRL